MLGATEALICEGGLAAVTTQSVARKGGFAEGTIYRHFESRDDLIVSTLRERLWGDFDEAVGALVRRAGEGTVAKNLADFVESILPIYPVLAPAVGMLAADPALAARNAAAMCADGKAPRRFADRVASYFIEERRLGRVSSDIDPKAAAGMLVGLCFHRSLLTHLFGTDQTGLTDADLPSAVALILSKGVSA